MYGHTPRASSYRGIYRGRTLSYASSTPTGVRPFCSFRALDQHSHDSVNAPAPPPHQLQDLATPSDQSVLGAVPHQLRGFLAQFRNLPLVGAAYDQCTGCSETVSPAYTHTHTHPDDDSSLNRFFERMSKRDLICF